MAAKVTKQRGWESVTQIVFLAIIKQRYLNKSFRCILRFIGNNMRRPFIDVYSTNIYHRDIMDKNEMKSTNDSNNNLSV